jgi:hypothetical protein
MACQRYYEKSYEQQIVPGTASAYPGRSILEVSALPTPGLINLAHSVPFRVIKRVGPTIKTYSPLTGATGKALDGYATVDVTCSVNSSASSFDWKGTSSVSSQWIQMSIQWTANARL